MIACPRCGYVDDGSSYQCPACFTVLQPDLADAQKRQQRTDNARRAAAASPPASHPPPVAAQPPGPTPDNPYQAPAAPHQPFPPHGGYDGGYRPVGMPEVPTYLAHAILATLFCCMPAGVAAIVYAAKVSTLQAVGDYQGAGHASDQARMWCWISFGGGLLVVVLYALVGLMASSQPQQY